MYDIGDIIKFGAADSIVKIRNITYKLCATRLEKPHKELLKSFVKTTGSIVVSRVEDSTHLIANKVAATIKLLQCIAENRPIVRLDW